MKIKELVDNNYANVFDLYSRGTSIVAEAEGWRYYSSVKVNAPIAIGWLSDDSLFIVNADGLFIYDTTKREIVFEDFESELLEGMSHNNLRYFIKEKGVEIDVFGIRGGGGNLFTNDNKWSIRLVNLAWNIVVPILTNMRTSKFYFLRLHQLFYEGHKHIGFSNSGKYFVVMGDEGLDIYSMMS